MEIKVKNIIVTLDKSKIFNTAYIHEQANKFECEECRDIFYHAILGSF